MAASTPFPDIEQTVHLLADGFQALLSEVESLAHRERDLKNSLDLAYDEVRDSLCLSTTLLA